MDKPDNIHDQSHFNYYWYDALNFEGAKQMMFVRSLMESRPFISPQRIPDQSILSSENGDADDRIQCARAEDYSYIMVYTTNGRSFSIDLSRMPAKNLNAWWYNPRNGENYGNNNKAGNMPLKISNKNNVQVFTPPTNEGEKNDWVLILDDASKGFSAPGHFFH